MADGESKGPVRARKQQNRVHADVAVPYFVDLANFSLKGRSYGPDDKFKDGVGLGPRELDPTDFLPLAEKELEDATKQGAVRAYLAKHKVTNRWVYAFSVEDGKTPVFHFEMRFDAQGRVRYLSRDDFDKFRASGLGVDDEPDASYLARRGWKGGATKFLQALPIAKHNARVKWHFFGMSVRLPKEAVGQLESVPGILGLDPGFDNFSRTKPPEDGEESFEGGQRIHVNDGVLIRVFDPLVIAGNMGLEFRQAATEYLAFATPVSTNARGRKTQVRMAARAIANHVQLTLQTSPVVDLNDNIAMGDAVLDRIREPCFTTEELEFIDFVALTPGVFKSHNYFLMIEKNVREFHLERMNNRATKLLLWLTSMSWAFVETHHLGTPERINTAGHHLLCTAAAALERIGETDQGRAYLGALTEHIENNRGSKDKPNQQFLEAFLLRNTPPPSGLDIAKVVFKAGKTPFDLWSKLLTIYGAHNKSLLQKLFEDHKGTIDAKILEQLEGLGSQKKVFATTAFVMNRRLKQAYGAYFFKLDLSTNTTLDVKNGLWLFEKGNPETTLDNLLTVQWNNADDLGAQLQGLRNRVGGFPDKPKLFQKLEFEHISWTAGVIGLFYGARSLYIAATEKGAWDVTKSSFEFFKALYSLPWVSAQVAKRLKDVTVPGLSKRAATWIGQRGFATIGFVLQVVTVAFSAEDLWSKANNGTQQEAISSGLSLASEVLVLISAGMVVASGGTLTPAAAIVAGAAAVIAIGQFVYDLVAKPEDETPFALRNCMFGVDFMPSGNARPWQGCFNLDFDEYDPDQHRLNAYLNQLTAFSNLMHNYNIVVELSDETNDRAAKLRILPGALPRDAFFVMAIDMEWFDTDGEVWGATLEAHFYPFDRSAPPLPKNVRAPIEFRALRSRGIVDPRGLPCEVFVERKPAQIELVVSPRAGHILRWSGTVDNTIAGAKTPVRVFLRYEVAYRVESTLTDDGQTVRLRVRLLPGTDADIELEALTLLLVIDRLADGSHQPLAKQIEIALPSGNGSDEIIEVPRTQSDNLGQETVTGIQVVPRLRDGFLGESGIAIEGTEVFSPGSGPPDVTDTVLPLSKHAYEFEMDYIGAVAHAGKEAEVTFRPQTSTLRRVDDPTKTRTDRLGVKTAVLQFVRNEGKGEPLEQGSRGNALFVALGARPELQFVGRTAGIHLFDVLTARMTVDVHLADGTRKFTDSLWHEGKEVGWSWPTAEQENAFTRTARVRLIEARLTLNLDGTEDSLAFLPYDLTSSGPSARVTAHAELTPGTSSLPIGVESSEAVALLACKAKP
jgi:hypothetical protein